MAKLIKFFLTVLLGTALGYSWATYHATLRYEQYERDRLLTSLAIQDCDSRLKMCEKKKTRWIYVQAIPNAPKGEPQSGKLNGKK